MSLCQSIDTLAMAYLDDELVVEERRELELHMLDCSTCRHHVDHEQAEIALVRKALVPPPAPDLFKARIARALDQEDREAVRAERAATASKLSRWFLPGSAMAVAVVAVVVAFAAIGGRSSDHGGGMASEAASSQSHTLPLEVQGASTRPWLRENFAPIEPPQFRPASYDVDLLGARMAEISGHKAAQLRYLVTSGLNRFTLTTIMIDELRPEDLAGGTPIKFGDRVLYIHDANGMPAVTYVDEEHMGYVFASQRLTAQELLEVVVSSDLIGRAQQGR